MKELFTPDEMSEVAARWGKSPTYVRRAVDRGLIPPAHPIGQHQPSAGVEWVYDPQAMQCLRALLHLEAQGYRGKGLRFALWWMGLLPWSEDIPALVLELGHEARTVARERLIERSISTEGTLLIRHRAPNRVDTIEELVDPAWARQIVQNPMVASFAGVSARSLSAAFSLDIDAQAIAPVGYSIVAGILGVPLGEIGLDPSKVHIELTNFVSSLPVEDTKDTAQSLPAWLQVMPLVDWYDQALTVLEQVPADEWDRARQALRMSPIDKGMQSWLLGIIRAAHRQAPAPRRTFLRHPGLRFISLMITVLYVAIKVALEQLAKQGESLRMEP